jgi:putative transposase
LSARLPILKRTHPWLADPPAQALQQTLKDLCEAWDKHRTSGAGTPRFKARGEGESLRFVQDLVYDAAGGRVRLPKLGFVRMRHSRVAEGVLKNATVRHERGRWVVSLQMRRDVDVPRPVGAGAVGLDFGVATTIMPSTGEPFELPARLSKYERRIKRLQQSLTRKRKGSKNRGKARNRLARCHAKAVALRRDFLHKATTALVDQHALIAIENLRVQQMTRSAAGTSARPGKCVKQKRGLNRTILRQGWGLARRMLEYKGARRGVCVVAVAAAFTSQTCEACGHVDRANRRTRSAFACVACGHHDQADWNAAKNILAKALTAGPDH